jgi:hypothetical protein
MCDRLTRAGKQAAAFERRLAAGVGDEFALDFNGHYDGSHKKSL